MVRPANRDSSLYFDYPHYPFITPEEMSGTGHVHDVVIVGAGPVGVSAALELARHGVRSAVLDNKDTVNDGSRAICVARHSFEGFQQLGVVDRFIDKALPWTHGTSYYKDQPIYRLQMPHSAHERYYPMYNIQQQYIEKYLIDAAMDNPLIDMRWQHTVTDVKQNNEQATLDVDTPEGSYQLNSRYVLAADGAKSVVRRACNLKLNGDAYEGWYVIVDIQMQSDYPTERRAFFDSTANPDLTVLVHKQPDNIWRIDYQIDEDVEAEDELKEEHITARIQSILDSVGEKGPWELEWWSIYKAYTLALDDYRHGNIFFIGDAAHLVPIFGVRGLNSGLADAMNIGWKLAWVINGWGKPGLLDSYSPERRGATLDVFNNATKSTKFMTPPTRGYEILREAALSLALREDFTKPLVNPRQSQPYNYTASPITFYQHHDQNFIRGPAAGAALINMRLAVNNYLFEHLGQEFTGIYFCEADTVPDEVEEIAERFSVGGTPLNLLVVARKRMSSDKAIILSSDTDEIFHHYDAVDGTFYLCRPDRHVIARWKHLDLNQLNDIQQTYLE